VHHDDLDALTHGAALIHDRWLLADGTWLPALRGADGETDADGDEQPDERTARLDAIQASLDAGDLTREQVDELTVELTAMFRAAAGEGGQAAVDAGERIAELLTAVQARGTELDEERAATDERFREIAEANGISLDEPAADSDADGGDTGDGDTDGDAETETETDDAGVAVVAAGGRPGRRGLPRRPASGAQQIVARPRSALRNARIEVHGSRVRPQTNADLLMALWDAKTSLGRMPERGIERNIPVVTATWEHQAGQSIAQMSGAEATEVMDRFLGFHALQQPAIVAAGGICAPLAVDYDIPILGTDDRPVRDSLPSFQADRGGVRWIPSPTLAADVPADSWGVWTVEDDEDETPTEKVCAVLECADETSMEIEAIYRCLEMSNFQNRYSRDRADVIMSLIRTAFARFAETRILSVISAGSTQLTWTHELGAARAYLEMLSLANVRYRRRHRIPRGVNLVHPFPDWLYDLIRSDIANGLPGGPENLAIADAMIDSWFRSRNVRPVPFLDGENAGQTMAEAVANGALADWPATVVSYLYAEGTWVNADGGQMNLGVVRDSTLNARNRVRLFEEDFEKVFKRGIESWRISSTICPNGAVAGTVEPEECAVS
jgi:hypothetical protein